MDVPGSPYLLVAHIQGRGFAFDMCTQNELNENESKHSMKNAPLKSLWRAHELRVECHNSRSNIEHAKIHNWTAEIQQIDPILHAELPMRLWVCDSAKQAAGYNRAQPICWDVPKKALHVLLQTQHLCASAMIEQLSIITSTGQTAATFTWCWLQEIH